MCGIVGYVGSREATPLLVAGLKKLEYRGYDSAGLAVTDSGVMQVMRCRGKLAGLEDMVAKEPPQGTVGVGHTRWATHGRPSEINAHPHKIGPVAVVHNGIIENHMELRARLEATGRKFSSETDTEIAAHLIDEALIAGAPTLVAAVRKALQQVSGAYALAVVSETHPNQIVGAKMASPLVVGIGKGETFLASDVPAFLEHTRDVIFLDEGDIVEITERRDQAVEPGRHPGQAPHQDHHLGRGAGREGRLPALHAQGDPRAAARHRRHAARPPAYRSGRRRPRGVRGRRQVAAPGRAARLRHLVPRRSGRQVPDRVGGPHPVRGRSGERVPLSRSRRRPRRHDRRDLAERRDRRHPGRREGGARPRLPRARDLQRGRFGDPALVPRLALHARRPRDRRGVDQVLHRPARGAGPGGDPPRTPNRHARPRSRRQAGDRAVGNPDEDGRGAGRSRRHDHVRGARTRTRATSSSWAAGRTIRSPSRGPSS